VEAVPTEIVVGLPFLFVNIHINLGFNHQRNEMRSSCSTEILAEEKLDRNKLSFEFLQLNKWSNLELQHKLENWGSMSKSLVWYFLFLWIELFCFIHVCENLHWKFYLCMIKI